MAAMNVGEYEAAKVGYKALPPPTDPRAEKLLRTRGIQNYARMHSNIERMQSEMQEFMEEQMRRAIEADPRIRQKQSKHKDSHGNPRPPTAEEEKDLDRQQELLDELISNIYGVRQSSTRFMRLFLNEEEKRHVGARTHESFGRDPGDKDRPTTPRRYNPYRHHTTPDESSSSRWGVGSNLASGNTSPSNPRFRGQWGQEDAYLPTATMLNFHNMHIQDSLNAREGMFGDDAYVSDETDENFDDTTPLQVPLLVAAGDPLGETRAGASEKKLKKDHGSESDDEVIKKKKKKEKKDKDNDESPTRRKEEHKRRKEEEKQKLRAEKEARKQERDAIRARRNEERTLKKIQKEEEEELLRQEEKARREAERIELQKAVAEAARLKHETEEAIRRQREEAEAERRRKAEEDALVISPADDASSPSKSIHTVHSAANTDLSALNARALLVHELEYEMNKLEEDDSHDEPVTPIVQPSTMRDPIPLPLGKTKVKNKTTYGICQRSSTGSAIGDYEADEPFGQGSFNSDVRTDPTSVASVILRIFGDDTTDTHMNIGVSRHKYHHPRGIPSPRARSRSMATSQATTPRRQESIANSMPSQSINIQSVHAASASVLPQSNLQPTKTNRAGIETPPLPLVGPVPTVKAAGNRSPPKSPTDFHREAQKMVRGSPDSPVRQPATTEFDVRTPSSFTSPQQLDLTAAGHRGRNSSSGMLEDQSRSVTEPPSVGFEGDLGSPKPRPTREKARSSASPPGGKIIKKIKKAPAPAKASQNVPQPAY